MPGKKEQSATLPSNSGSDGGTATMEPPKTSPKKNPRKSPPEFLPPWKLLLHNDDKNSMDFVVGSLIELTPLKKEEAIARTKEADKTGVALLLVTHKERAELYQDQLQSKGLTITIEPAEQE